MKVGVVQMQCDDEGDKAANMATLERLVDEAMSSNNPPELLLAPEFAICGYSYDEATCWKTAEPQGGLTEQFVCRLAQKHSIYFGLSYLEARQEGGSENDKHSTSTCIPPPKNDDTIHMLNTFVLAGPDGAVVGRVCKATPCSVEAYLFTAPSKPPCHVIEIDNKLRIGVLICYENYVSDSVEELHRLQQKDGSGLDLLLQPFSGPLADDSKKYVKESLRQMYKDVCPTNSQLLQIPALYATKVGKWQQPCPSTLLPMQFNTEFPGGSTICNAKGEILGRLDETEQAVLVRDIELGRDNQTEKLAPVPRYWGGYSNSTPFLKFCKVYEFLGSRSYQSSDLRKRLALEALSSSSSATAES